MALTGLLQRAPAPDSLGVKQRIRTHHPLGPPMRHTLRAMDHASPERLRAFQDRRLRAMVRWAAARSPFYRSWFAENGVDPRSIRTTADLAVLPLLERSDLLDDPDRFLAYPAALTWPAVTSGTSGGGVVQVRRTPGSAVYEQAALQRQWGWFDVPARPRRLALRAEGAGLDDKGGAGDAGSARDGEVLERVPGTRIAKVSGYGLTRLDPERLLAEVRAFAPEVVEGWPSAICALAGLLQERGERLPVAGVITSSESTSAVQAELMTSVFAAPLVDHYGQTERVCMAGSCEAGGYHVFDDYGVVELVPTVDAAPDEGDRLEVVGTPLHNWGFPLFRYRTGDTVGRPPTGPCACGRAFTRLDPVSGRQEDAFTTADGRRVVQPSAPVIHVRGIREGQVAQLAPGVFEIRMALRPDADPAAVRAEVQARADRYYGPGQTLRFRLVDRVPRSGSGKLRPSVVEGPADGATEGAAEDQGR